jgi:hypothetical protein
MCQIGAQREYGSPSLFHGRRFSAHLAFVRPEVRGRPEIKGQIAIFQQAAYKALTATFTVATLNEASGAFSAASPHCDATLPSCVVGHRSFGASLTLSTHHG